MKMLVMKGLNNFETAVNSLKSLKVAFFVEFG